EERRPLSDVVWPWSAASEAVTAPAFYAVWLHLQKLRERVHRLFDNVDFLVLPTVARPPYAAELPGYSRENIFEPWANTCLFNLGEQPAASLPCGVTPDGAPIGLQIVGPRFADRAVLALSRSCEQLFPDGLLRQQDVIR